MKPGPYTSGLKKYFSSRRNILGYSLIEFTISFLITVPMVIATLDLTKVFQARSTAKAAVATTLRCMTVTDDPACSSVSPAAAAPVYRVRAIKSPVLNYPLVTYGGEVKYLEGPQAEVGPFKARILDQGFGEYYPLQAEMHQYSVIGQVSYGAVSEISVPGMVRNEGNKENPVFEGDFTRVSVGGNGVTASAALSNGSGEQSDFTPYSRASRSDAFQVPEVFSSSYCLKDPYSGLDRKGSYDCFGTNSSGAKFIRGILHVKGSGTASGANVCGRAKLDLEVLENGKWELAKDLTGQSFRGNAGNFVPRGYRRVKEEIAIVNGVVPLTYDREETSDSVPSEAFQGEIRFELGKKYRVVVTAQVDTTIDQNKTPKCEAGSVAYKVSGVSVYFPGIKNIVSPVNCSEKLGDCEEASSCTEATPQVLGYKLAPEVFSQIQISSPIKGPQTSEVKIQDCAAVVGSVDRFNQIAADPRRSAAGLCSCSASPLRLGAKVNIGPVACPETNTGVSDVALTGAEVKNSEQAQISCAVNLDSESGYSSSASKDVNRYWSTKEKLLSEKIIFAPVNCSEVYSDPVKTIWNRDFPSYKMPINSGISVNNKSEKFLHEMGRESPDYPLYDPVDPEELIKKDEYRCGSFKPLTLKITELQKKPEAGSDNIFDKENLVNCLGGANSNSWKQMIALQLRANYLNVSQAFFVPKTISTGIFKAGCGESLPVVLDSICKPYSYMDVSSLSSELLPETSNGTTLPSKCHESCTSCQLELVNFSGNLNPEVDLQKEKALEKGRAELQAFSPWLSRDCGEKDCVGLDLVKDGERLKGTATIKVPLFSKSLVNSVFGNEVFGGKAHFELHYSTEESFESELAKS